MNQKLKNVLVSNALFSMTSGLIALFFSRPISVLMNIEKELILQIIGGGLVLFGGFVLSQAFTKKANLLLIKSIVIQDWIWVIASVIVIVFQLFTLSFNAYLLIGIIAIIVANFAYFQNKYL